MSVVGPRPLLVRYLPLYNEYQARRHELCITTRDSRLDPYPMMYITEHYDIG